MNEYQNFTSLPPDQEQTFVVFEKRTVETGKRAMMIALISAGAFFLVTLGVVFSHDKPPPKMKGDMGMLKKGTVEKKAAPAPVEKPAAATEAAPGSADEAGASGDGDGADKAAPDKAASDKAAPDKAAADKAGE